MATDATNVYLFSGASGAASALAAYVLHGGENVTLPLIGSVSAPVGFGISTALSVLAGTYIAVKEPLPSSLSPSPKAAVANDIVYGQVASGLSQTALMKGFATNSNVSLGESFGFGFIAPLVGAEALALLSVDAPGLVNTARMRY